MRGDTHEQPIMRAVSAATPIVRQEVTATAGRSRSAMCATTLGGAAVVAGAEKSKEQVEEGAPPNWTRRHKNER